MSDVGKIQIWMQLEKTTPGAVRYQEVDDNNKELTVVHGAKLGKLYVRKSAFPNQGAFPEFLKVTIVESSR